MADEILFAGGRLDSVAFSGTVAEVTTAGSFDSAYADCAVQLTGSSSTFTATFRDSSFAPTDVVTGETAYGHCELHFSQTTTAAQSVWEFIDNSGFPWLALRSTTTSNVYCLCYNSGTGASPVWTQVGSTFSMPISTRYTLDMKVTLGSPHVCEFSVGGTAQASGSFTQASLTSLRGTRGYGLFSSSVYRFSQIMATRGISTINGKVDYNRATGAGTNSGWTGAAGNVNEAINSDATVDSATSAGVKQTYAMGDVTVPSGLVIKSVFHWMRAKNDGSAPANIKSVIRSGGTDYSSANVSGMGTSFAAVGMRYDTDPDTSAAWTQSGWNAAEAGYESAT